MNTNALSAAALLPALLLALSAGAPGLAQATQIIVQQIDCLPAADNGVIHAEVKPELVGVSTRLFFRWIGDEDYYYVYMTGVGLGRYWAVPPKPDPKNEMIEYYVAMVDTDGQMVAMSDVLTVPVQTDCPFALTDHHRGVAENMTVGETTFDQVGKEVVGFLCDGIVNRISPIGILRGDERCRACVIATRSPSLPRTTRGNGWSTSSIAD